jgi:hypothetical protein
MKSNTSRGSRSSDTGASDKATNLQCFVLGTIGRSQLGSAWCHGPFYHGVTQVRELSYPSPQAAGGATPSSCARSGLENGSSKVIRPSARR